jgi:hypothetical protein
MYVTCECCVLSGRGLCDKLITRSEEFYWVRCAWVWSRNLKRWGGLGPLGAVERLWGGDGKQLLTCICLSGRLFRMTLEILRAAPHTWRHTGVIVRCWYVYRVFRSFLKYVLD